MNRYKFRAWDKQVKKMARVIGLGWYETDSGVISRVNIEYSDGSHSGITKWGMDEIELMQFTGIQDFDKKEVFEGDILLNNLFGDLWECKFKVGLADNNREYGRYVVELIGDGHTEDLCSVDGFTVVGNKYEHPHLLEQSHD